MTSVLYKIPQLKFYSDNLKYLSVNSNYENIVYNYFYNNYENLLSYTGTERIKPTLFIGAGFSISSGISDWNVTLEKMVNYYKKIYQSLGFKGINKLVSSSVIEHIDNLLNESKTDYEMKLDLGEYLQSIFDPFYIK